MKRKKILALLMVAALCVGTVAGCGSKDTESSKSESGKNENSERDRKSTRLNSSHPK